MPGMDYLDNYEYYDNYNEDPATSLSNDYDNSISLNKGCINHVATLHTVSFVYTTALGQSMWFPDCVDENPTLYEGVQCRIKDNKDEVCWCVNETSGIPVVHHYWARNEIDAKMCRQLENEYGLGKKKIAKSSGKK